jgi:hypothetical protein
MYIENMANAGTKGSNTDGGAEERREYNYTFLSEKDLTAFFSSSLPRKVIKRAMNAVKQDFIRRKLSTSHEHKLQFLKKCEGELVRLARNELEVEKVEEAGDAEA